MSNIVKTECSSCFADVTINLAAMTVTTHVPSNGKRGSLHVPAHKITEDMSDDGTLALWDCGVCGYADSTYLDPIARKELAS